MKTTYVCIGVVIAIVIIILGCFPKVYTGDYSVVTVDRIEKHSNGQVDFYLSYLTSDKTLLCEEFYIAHKYVGGGSGSGGTSFPAWPSKSSSMSTFNLLPENTSRKPASPQPIILNKRLLIEKHASYTIYPNDPLILCNFKTANGEEHLGRISVYSNKNAEQSATANP